MKIYFFLAAIASLFALAAATSHTPLPGSAQIRGHDFDAKVSKVADSTVDANIDVVSGNFDCKAKCETPLQECIEHCRMSTEECNAQCTCTLLKGTTSECSNNGMLLFFYRPGILY